MFDSLLRPERKTKFRMKDFSRSNCRFVGPVVLVFVSKINILIVLCFFWQQSLCTRNVRMFRSECSKYWRRSTYDTYIRACSYIRLLYNLSSDCTYNCRQVRSWEAGFFSQGSGISMDLQQTSLFIFYLQYVLIRERQCREYLLKAYDSGVITSSMYVERQPKSNWVTTYFFYGGSQSKSQIVQVMFCWPDDAKLNYHFM